MVFYIVLALAEIGFLYICWLMLNAADGLEREAEPALTLRFETAQNG
jgi:hypothetical protein